MTTEEEDRMRRGRALLDQHEADEKRQIALRKLLMEYARRRQHIESAEDPQEAIS